MKPTKQANCSICQQPFEAKPIYEEAEQDGKPDIFQGYQNICKGCLENPYRDIDRRTLDAVDSYESGLLTKAELIERLDNISEEKMKEAHQRLTPPSGNAA